MANLKQFAVECEGVHAFATIHGSEEVTRSGLANKVALQHLTFLAKQGALPDTTSFRSPSDGDAKDFSTLEKIGLVTSSGSPGSYQITWKGLTMVRPCFRVHSPALLCEVRDGRDFESYTMLELLLSLTNAGWSHRIVDAFKPSIGAAPFTPKSCKKVFFTECAPSGTTLKYYLLALCNSQRCFERGVSAIHHGCSLGYYRCLVYAPSAEVRPGMALKFYKKLMFGSNGESALAGVARDQDLEAESEETSVSDNGDTDVVSAKQLQLSKQPCGDSVGKDDEGEATNRNRSRKDKTSSLNLCLFVLGNSL